MPKPSEPTAAPGDPAGLDRWVAGLALLLTFLAFWPLMGWIARETMAREQLQQTFILLVFAGVYGFWVADPRPRFSFSVDGAVLRRLGAAYLLILVALFFSSALLLMAGFLAAAAAAAAFLLPPASRRLAHPLLAGLGAFLIFTALFPLLDWPLRQMAGIYSAHLLDLLGWAPQLALVQDPEPHLLLSVGGKLFLVATECNGFGLITTGTLLALILGFYMQAPLWWRIALLPAAAFLGFVFNLLRILAISLLAPYFPDHYDLLHETAGITALYAGLGSIWWLAHPRLRPPGPATAGNASQPSPA